LALGNLSGCGREKGTSYFSVIIPAHLSRFGLPMTTPHQHDPRLARMLILDELFDLSLYKARRGI